MNAESQRAPSAARALPDIPAKPAQRDLAAASRTFEAWIRANIPGAADLRVVRAQSPDGVGVANETILIDAQQTIDGKRRPTGYVVRVDTPDHLFMDTDLHVHYLMYETLHGAPGIPVPRVLGFEPDRSLIGERFFVMDRIEGRVPPDVPHYTQAGWVTELSAPEREKMWRDMIGVMARMHARPRSDFPFLERPHLGRTGLEQALNHWLNYAKWCRGDQFDVVRRGGAWLLDHLPTDVSTCLSWGDARPQNVMFRDGEIVAIFDWDMVSLAGAESDLAWWVQQTRRRLPGMGTGGESVALWERLSGRSARHMEWHLAFLAFQTALIMIRLPALLHAQNLINDEGYAAYLAHPGEALANALDLPWDGPPLPPKVKWYD